MTHKNDKEKFDAEFDKMEKILIRFIVGAVGVAIIAVLTIIFLAVMWAIKYM